MAENSNFEVFLKEREARRRRNEIKAIFAIGFVLGLLFFLEMTVFDFRGATGVTNLLFFSLININVILAIVLLFLIMRNITKLIFERRRKVLGAKLRTRLVMAFAAFALIPTMILFYTAMTFISNSIERWFALQIESSLEESLKVAQSYYETMQGLAKHHAQGVADWLEQDPAFRPPPEGVEQKVKPLTPDQIKDFLEERRKLLKVEALEVYRAPDQLPLVAADKAASDLLNLSPKKDFIKDGFAGKVKSEVLTIGDAELVRGIAPVTNAQNETTAVVVASYLVKKSLVKKMKQIQGTYEQYQQLRVMENPIRTNYLIILALIYMFIFFSATWFGFYLARQITEPLQHLAEGARRVAAGEKAVQIEKVADDEMGILVEAFNRMWADLSASQKALEGAMENLEQTNVELERRRASMEAVLSNVAAGVLSFDSDGRVTTVNPSAERILGIKAGEALTKTWTDVFAPEIADKFRRLGEELLKSRKRTVQGQVEIMVGGESRTVLAVLSVIRGAPHDAAGAVLVVEDLTELLKVQRVAAWQEVARRIAHEIKNPLTPIQLAAQRLRKRYGTRFDPEQDQVFFDSTGTIVRQVDQMKKMVQEFSDFARMAETKPAPTDLVEIGREVTVLFSEAHKRIKFNYQPGGDLPRMLLDGDQIKRALINVLDNAVASIDGRGEINIGMNLIDLGRIVRLEVADTGQGLPPEYRIRVFEPYFSTKKMGTGLGLAIVHRIVMDHGGSIRLADNQPKGTIVIIELPVRAIETAGA